MMKLSQYKIIFLLFLSILPGHIIPLPAQVSSPANLNHDQSVDLNDFTLWVSRWLRPVNSPDAESADLNRDGRIDGGDFSVLAQYWLEEASPIIISEFLAINDSPREGETGLRDEDGDCSDWIELYNRSQAPVNLASWYLTDKSNNLRKWQFPEITVEPEEFLLIFASGKDRAQGNAELHANFKLSGDGEYLALVKPDGRGIVQEFYPAYPPQFENVSHGLEMMTNETFVSASIQFAYYVPTAADADADWRSLDYDDSAWDRTDDLRFRQLNEQGLIGHWKLDVIDNGYAIDSSGNGSHGVVEGTPEIVPGKVDFALDCDGATDRVSLGDLGNYKQVTIAFYMNGDNNDQASFQGLVSSAAWEEGVFHIAAINGKLEVYLHEGGSKRGRLTSPRLTDHQWYHIVVTADVESNELKLYLDGALVDSDDIAPLDTDIKLIEQYIGFEGDNAVQRYFNGEIDDVRIYGRILDAEEIEQPFCTNRLQNQMLGVNASLWVRVPFEIADPETFDNSVLRIRYEDGFVAYLNGREIARRNAPESMSWNAAATKDRTAEEAERYEEIMLPSFAFHTRPGRNILAIHALNDEVDNADFFLMPALTGFRINQYEDRYFSSPSPGTVNVNGINLNGPVISHVNHVPARPGPEDDVVVTASIAPRWHPIDSVVLTYRVMYDGEISIPMRDAGQNGDLLANDHIYTAVIPASAYAAGQMVRYYITATDTQGNPARKPEYLRFGQSAEYFGTVVTDPDIPPTQLPILEWFVADPLWYKEPSGNNRDYTYASVWYGRFYDNIRVRVRGGITQNQSKPNLKLDFYHGSHFEYSPDESRVEEFNLQSLYGEIPKRTYMRDPLAYQVFRDSGAACPHSFYVHVRQNGKFHSLAAWTEQVDKTFLERNNLDPDGSFYKASYDAWLQPDFEPGDFVKALPDDNNYNDLRQFAASLALTDPLARKQFVFDNVNIPQVIHYLAVTLLGPNHDRLQHNYYLYRDAVGTGEWSMIPWDMDRWFPQGGLLTHPNAASIFYGDSDHTRYDGANPDQYNRLNDAIFDIPETRQMFLAHLRQVIEEFDMAGTEPGYLEENIDQIQNRIALDAKWDNAKWGTGDLEAGVLALKNTVAVRRAQLCENRDIPPAPEDITTLELPLIVETASKKIFVPMGYVDSNWKSDSAFDDGSWIMGMGGVGYNVNSDVFQDFYGIDIQSQMYDDGQNPQANATCYIRVLFDFDPEAAGTVHNLYLKIRYDDGFVAYLNGTELSRSNVTGLPQWNSAADWDYPDDSAVNLHVYDISQHVAQLQAGTNVLAIHGLNVSADNPNFLISVALTALTERIQTICPNLMFGQIEFNPDSGNQDEEYIELINPNDFALDISGWKLAGGVSYSFQPGTVIPANNVLYVSPDVKAFRLRAEFPTGGNALFVQGDYQGHLSNWGENLYLYDRNNCLRNSFAYPGEPSPAQQALRITEIMYHPPDPDENSPFEDENFEFIELLNISPDPLLLDGIRFTNGISYQFPMEQNTILPPGQYIVVVKNRNAFTQLYDDAGINLAPETYTGNLSNGGEKIKLEDANRNTILEFSYEDDWYPATDGQGHSLAIVDPITTSPDNWCVMESWQASPILGGTPGRS